MFCPCQDCPERRLICHDHCAAYKEYHANLLAAKAALKKANAALDFLTEGYRRKNRRTK